MKIEPINAYSYTCTPMRHESCPIRSMVVTIYAKNREEADELFDRHAHQFFDQDLNRMVTTLGGGYRGIKDEPKTNASE